MIKKILVPLDGSQLAEKALPYAEELAQRFDASLILMQVTEPILMVTSQGSPIYASDNGHLPDDASLYLSSVKEKLQADQIPAEDIVSESHGIAETIIEQAFAQRADLIVMSTHGRSGIGRWVYGSIATKVLQQAPCPVFLVRADALVTDAF